MHRSTIKAVSTVLICVSVCLSSACTTMRPVTVDSTGDRIRAEVKSGDTVRVRMMDGAVHSLKVTKLGDASLSGDIVNTWSRNAADVPGAQLDLRYQDIQQIAIRHVNVFATVAIVVVVVLATAVGIATGGGRHSPGYNR
jgi:hypothetical protein